jgi:septum formation protein
MSQSKQINNQIESINRLNIVLASSSPFRQKLLKDAGITFKIQNPEGDEKSIQGLPPHMLAIKRAEFKALDVAVRSPAESIVIGTDQVLGFEGKSFDKSKSPEDASRKLQLLQGRVHTLHSAFCLIKVGPRSSVETKHLEVVDIQMTMRNLTDREIADYIKTGEWQGCVGGYRIEGKGRNLFSNIAGEPSAIIGLPMAATLKALENIAQNP